MVSRGHILVANTAVANREALQVQTALLVGEDLLYERWDVDTCKERKQQGSVSKMWLCGCVAVAVACSLLPAYDSPAMYISRPANSGNSFAHETSASLLAMAVRVSSQSPHE